MNVLARKYYDGIKRNNKPIILSHRISLIPCIQFVIIIWFKVFSLLMDCDTVLMISDMLPGLQQGQENMSKSDPYGFSIIIAIERLRHFAA